MEARNQEMAADQEMLSRLFLRLLSLVFSFICLKVFLSPIESMKDHKLDLSTQPASALAEIRAYYLGTMGTLAIVLLYKSSGDEVQRREGFFVCSSVLGLFVLGRMYSFFVDGPTSHIYSDVMWAIELLGTIICLVFYSKQYESKELHAE